MMKINNYKLVKIEKIEQIVNEDIKMVHDLTVSDNNSYTANGKIVHNCLTTQQLGIGYPMASLIQECYKVSLTLDNPAKIVADGGMQKYSDIIKAIALGADYVMLGSIINKCLESCGDNYFQEEANQSKIKITPEQALQRYNEGKQVLKLFRGMSTKEVQKKWGNENLKTSEGVVRYREVEYTLNQWVDNFESYLRSAMSYCDARTIEDFVYNAEFINITPNAFKRFNK